MFHLGCPLTHFMLPCVSQLNNFPNVVYCVCTEGREDTELPGGKLWKGELWEISEWAAQRYSCVYIFVMFGFCSASLSVLHISALHCVTGIVGDIVLNHTPLRGFTTFCLDMKPDFMKRSANPVSFYVMITRMILRLVLNKDCKECFNKSYFRLMSSGQWKSDTTSPSIPGFFQARLHVEGSPSDTFIRLHVSEKTGSLLWNLQFDLVSLIFKSFFFIASLWLSN